jgi:hypothetical protein
MTPEELEALEGIDADAVNRIQQAINSFYGQEYVEASPQEAPSEKPAESTAEDTELQAAASGEGVTESPGSAASDTMDKSPEFADGAGEEGHSGAESIEGGTPEP